LACSTNRERSRASQLFVSGKTETKMSYARRAISSHRPSRASRRSSASTLAGSVRNRLPEPLSALRAMNAFTSLAGKAGPVGPDSAAAR
jgi:hypothetical protein